MERSRGVFEAQEVYGCRVIARAACRHRLPCPEAGWHDGARVHIDGWIFTTERAAQAFDLAQLAGPPRATWRVFPSWEAARAWLHAADWAMCP
jgi:hypothetical protein